ncbi:MULTISPECIES: saccharopine dehydrogenase family protein [unclassified Okeania]|uniref:saccharopine dehydrogenase family protein n=1 Tax=unclassified Okeania TaxID=2634635 RepID=UPI0013BBEB3D|nr:MULTISPECIES: saccharopine dehydrogenase NADP-binding domain-containing protein [unclassified Okeania]NES76408.1 KR domain-containing protein [Okeania sp. SIO1H4]NET13957.1 KR domain-containing protein [Okeania sp. SIO1H6]NET19856.1 KR domain-containing protein [Okeania sp. SIO1H5]NET97054.1 KR domain-containing protein [Okeania sp. SIO1H2]
MTNQVLIIGGYGRIGSSVARDLTTYANSEITITGRKQEANIKEILIPGVKYLTLDLANKERVRNTIHSYSKSSENLVIHCAGPFHHRDTNVLKNCIDAGINYVDISDYRGFTRKALEYSEAAKQAGVTAIINTGIFPGISNSLARKSVEQFDEPEEIHLSYVVGGSGGAGVTVMRTTFLGLQNPFEVWKNNKWEFVKPYSDRQVIDFPKPYGKIGVYWFDLPECLTLPTSFPVKTVTTKFGSFPDFYNHLTWMTAHLFPVSWLKNSGVVEFLSQVSYKMTQVTDKYSGTGVAIQAKVIGKKSGKKANFCSSIIHKDTATVTGIGAGGIAELILSGKLNKPGVWSVENSLSTELFEQVMKNRGFVKICGKKSVVYQLKS